jgi:hypothetical protein
LLRSLARMATLKRDEGFPKATLVEAMEARTAKTAAEGNREAQQALADATEVIDLVYSNGPAQRRTGMRCSGPAWALRSRAQRWRASSGMPTGMSTLLTQQNWLPTTWPGRSIRPGGGD